MKQPLFIFLFISAFCLLSCRKSGTEPDIKQFDDTQIKNYIAANGLTAMKKADDTTGIYYQVLGTDTGKRLAFSDTLSFVYTIKSFDNKFIASDTIANHYDGYLGHVSPNGLMLGIYNLLKTKGSRIRMLVPSHIAFGVNGVGSGSSTITTGRIAGNQCLDYYVNCIRRQDLYDDLVIRNYIKDKSLTGFSKTDDGIYYKVTTAGTGTSQIYYYSSVTGTYVGQFLNGGVFDSSAQTTATTFVMTDVISGLSEALEGRAVAGTSMTILIPSRLAYGTAGQSGSIPANACLRFDYQITGVSP